MPTYQLENFKQNVTRLLGYLERNDPRNLCAVFDIGTKATKLLVGPKQVPTKETWNSAAFFNDGQLFPLGSDFDIWRNRLDIKSSGALEGVCYFVEIYQKLLSGRGMPVEDMHGVGTAVFRWMNNRDEVLNHIRKRTGLDIHVLTAYDEAYLSCLSIFHTYAFGAGDQVAFGDSDAILLFDQGGGSTEVSYFRPKGDSTRKLDSLHEFGTVSLQKMFFNLRDKSAKDNEPPDPMKNRNRISTQFRRVNEYLVERVAEWPGFPELCSGNTKIHAYGMGTALSKCLRNGNNFSQHNRLLTIRDMDETLARQCQELDNSTQQVKTLYLALQKEQAEGGKVIRDRLVMLYGLPVYQQLLLKFGLDCLRFAGFGLRFGAYFAVCDGEKLDNLKSTPKAGDSSAGQPVGVRVQVFLSHSSADDKFAERIAAELREAHVDVWIDGPGRIRTGASFIDEIQEGLIKSDLVVAMFSKQSLKSDWFSDEWQAKMALGKKLNLKKVNVLPIKIDECDLPPLFAHRQCADFTLDYKSALKDLLQAINAYK